MVFRMNNIIQYTSIVFTIIYMHIYWSSKKRPSHYYSNSIQLVPIVSFVVKPKKCTVFRLVDLIETEMSICCCPFGKFWNNTYSTVVKKYGGTKNYFDFIVSSIFATFYKVTSIAHSIRHGLLFAKMADTSWKIAVVHFGWGAIDLACNQVSWGSVLSFQRLAGLASSWIEVCVIGGSALASTMVFQIAVLWLCQ